VRSQLRARVPVLQRAPEVSAEVAEAAVPARPPSPVAAVGVAAPPPSPVEAAVAVSPPWRAAAVVPVSRPGPAGALPVWAERAAEPTVQYWRTDAVPPLWVG